MEGFKNLISAKKSYARRVLSFVMAVALTIGTISTNMFGTTVKTAAAGTGSSVTYVSGQAVSMSAIKVGDTIERGAILVNDDGNSGRIDVGNKTASGEAAYIWVASNEKWVNDAGVIKLATDRKYTEVMVDNNGAYQLNQFWSYTFKVVKEVELDLSDVVISNGNAVSNGAVEWNGTPVSFAATDIAVKAASGEATTVSASDCTFKWMDESGATMTGVPSDCGSYKLEASINTDEYVGKGTVAFDIVRTTPVIFHKTETVSLINLMVGDILEKDVTVKDVKSVTSASAEVVKFEKGGTTTEAITERCKVTSTGAVYVEAVSEPKAQVEIDLTNVVIDDEAATATGTSIVYNGEPLKIATEAAVVSGGNGVITESAIEWTLRAASGSALTSSEAVNVGTYILEAKIAENDNYESEVYKKAFTITKRDVTVKVSGDNKKEYKEADSAINYEVVSGTILSADAVTCTCEGVSHLIFKNGALAREAGDNVSTYAIEIGTLDSANPNYNVTLTGDAVYEITPKTITADDVIINGGKDFDYTAKLIHIYNGDVTRVAVKVGNDLLTDKVDYDVTGDCFGKAITSYAITVVGKGNYKGTVIKTWKINQLKLNVSAEAVTAVYDGKSYSPKLNGLVSGTGSEADSVTYYEEDGKTPYLATPEFKKVGTHKVIYRVQRNIIDDEGTRVYEPVTGVAVVEIEKVTNASVTIDAVSLPYNTAVAYGDTYELASGEALSKVHINGLVSGDAVAEATITVDQKAKTVSASVIKIVNEAGEDVTAFYDIDMKVAAPCTIEAIDVEIKATNDWNKVYGSNDPELKYAVYATGTTSESVTLAGVEFKLERVSGEAVTEYAVNVTGNGNPDATVFRADVKDTFKIEQKKITDANVSLSKTFFTYDGSAKAPVVTVKVDNAVTSTSVEITQSATEVTTDAFAITGDMKATACGRYVITVKGLGNYTGEVNVDYVITYVEDTKVTYDGTPKELNVASHAGVKIEYATAAGVYSEQSPKYTEAGTYTIPYKMTFADNKVVSADATLVIEKQVVAVKPVNAEKVYGTADPAFTYEVYKSGKSLSKSLEEISSTAVTLDAATLEKLSESIIGSVSASAVTFDAISVTREAGEDVTGEAGYLMSVKADTTNNYIFVYPTSETSANKGVFTIKKAPVVGLATERAITVNKTVTNTAVDLKDYVKGTSIEAVTFESVTTDVVSDGGVVASSEPTGSSVVVKFKDNSALTANAVAVVKAIIKTQNFQDVVLFIPVNVDAEAPKAAIEFTSCAALVVDGNDLLTTDNEEKAVIKLEKLAEADEVSEVSVYVDYKGVTGAAITGWKPVSVSAVISTEGAVVPVVASEEAATVWVKITDIYGSVSYSASKKLTLDITAPEMTVTCGQNEVLNDNDIRKDAVLVSVKDAHFARLTDTVNGVTTDVSVVAVEGTSWKVVSIPADTYTHTFTAYDKLGNKTEFTVRPYTEDKPVVEAHDETILSKQDGYFTVEATAKQLASIKYKSTDEENWNSVTSVAVTTEAANIYKVPVNVGTYDVIVAGNTCPTACTSESVEVTIKQGNPISYKFGGLLVETDSPLRYEVVGKETISYKSSFEFNVIVKNGYDITTGFAVSVNNNVISPASVTMVEGEKVLIYVVKNVTADAINVTCTGAEITANAEILGAKFDAYVAEKVAALDYFYVTGDAVEIKKIVDGAVASMRAVTYAAAMTYAQNIAVIDKIYDKAVDAIDAYRNNKAVEYAEFEKYKEATVASLEAVIVTGDSVTTKAIAVEEAAKIEALKFNVATSLKANEDIVDVFYMVAYNKIVAQRMAEETAAALVANKAEFEAYRLVAVSRINKTVTDAQYSSDRIDEIASSAAADILSTTYSEADTLDANKARVDKIADNAIHLIAMEVTCDKADLTIDGIKAEAAAASQAAAEAIASAAAAEAKAISAEAAKVIAESERDAAIASAAAAAASQAAAEAKAAEAKAEKEIAEAKAASAEAAQLKAENDRDVAVASAAAAEAARKAAVASAAAAEAAKKDAEAKVASAEAAQAVAEANAAKAASATAVAIAEKDAAVAEAASATAAKLEAEGKAAEAASAEALALEAKAKAEASQKSAEEAKAKAEEAQKAAEEKAAKAEAAQKEAEAKATAAEKAQKAAETAKAEAEAKAASAEAAKKEAEAKAAAAEAAKAEAEAKAASAEAAKLAAEGKTAEAEAAKKAAEEKAAAAETAKAEAEAKAASAEAAKKEAEDKLAAYEKLAADKVEFDKFVDDAVVSAEAIVLDTDTDEVKELVAASAAAIDAVVFDESKTLDENKAVVEKMLSDLAAEVQAIRDKAPEFIPGDINNDGGVGLDDVLAALKLALGLEADGEVNIAAVDYDNSGEISLDEVLVTLKKALGIEK